MRAVSILGAGSWGTVLAILAAKKTPKVYLYDRDPARAAEMSASRENTRYLAGHKLPDAIEVTSDLEHAMGSSDLVLPVVPSGAFREMTRALAPYARCEHRIVHGTKGLEPETHKRMSEILIEETPCLRIGALSGPNLALELAQGQPGATVVSSRFDEVIDATQAAFSSGQLRVYGNHDLVGVEWAGSLKNILAVAAGMLHRLGLGNNALAMLLTRGLSEISCLITAMGAHSSTLLGLAGIGDVIATCTSPLSRNFRAGQLLAEGKTIREVTGELKLTAEGINTIRVATELAAQKKLEIPITRALWDVAYQGKPVADAIRELMERPASLEFTFR